MRILVIGDVVGRPGRRAVSRVLPGLVARLAPALVIANAENAAGGIGVTPETAQELLAAGVDVLTTGNHVWNKKGIEEFLDSEPRILRPANYPPGAPGRGWAAYTCRNGAEVVVVNLEGRVFLQPIDCPFRAADSILEEMRGRARTVVVDFHAEATSEKVAMGYFLDGRVSAVVGTHTHVQTADERVLPSGTAYITDLGMTGPTESVIGVRSEIIVERFLSGLPCKFDVASGPAQLQGVVLDIDESTGLARGIDRIREHAGE